MGIGLSRLSDLQWNIAPFVEPIPRHPEKSQTIEAVKAVNKAELFGQENELTFVIDPRSQKILVRIVNKDTHELVRQIPDAYLQRLASDLLEK